MDEDGAPAIIIGCSMFALMGFGILANGLGIAELVRNQASKVFPIFGIAISACAILPWLFLMVLGMMME